MTIEPSSSYSNSTASGGKPDNATVGVPGRLDAHYPPPLHKGIEGRKNVVGTSNGSPVGPDELSELPDSDNLSINNNRCPPAPGKPMSLLSAGKAGLIILARIVWASPWSLWGLGIGAVGLLSGGGVQWSGRILEFWGGFLPLFLKYFPFVAGSPVATFGHVTVGRSQRHLDACRPHQLVHVKQYELWGPLFVPSYLTCWCVLWCCGKRPYYDNPFERQAYGQTSAQ
jgi:hypothetical protein